MTLQEVLAEDSKSLREKFLELRKQQAELVERIRERDPAMARSAGYVLGIDEPSVQEGVSRKNLGKSAQK